MKLPEKVRVGETLSARWLNQVVDCLKELGKASNVSSNGSSTSSIEYSGSGGHDTKFRSTGGTDLQEFRVFPFQLRLKPKHLCDVDESGNWPKIAQMKVGAVVDYMGKTHSVPEGQPLFDYTDGWVDIGAFTEALQKAYCVITQNYKGEITKVEIKKEAEKFVPWGKSDINIEGEGKLSVFIGSYQLKRVEEVNRAHIYQAHIGTLDLQTVQVEKVFDENEELKDDPAGSGSGGGNGSGEAQESYYTAPESEEYESKPVGLFRKRDEHLFILKKLLCSEGLSLEDGKNVKIKLRRANSVWPDADASGSSQESWAEGEPIITLGGVEDIVFNKDIHSPEINSGIIRIPYADTNKDVTGVISGLVVKFAPAVLNDDGTISFLNEDGSQAPQNGDNGGNNADADGDGGGSASGSSAGAVDYTNQIVEGVIHLKIPIIQDVQSSSLSQSASDSQSYSDSYNPSWPGYDTASESDSASASASASIASESASGSSDSLSASGSDSGSASGSDVASGSADSAEDSGSSTPSASAGGSSSNAGSSSSGGSSGGSSSSGGGSIPGGSVPGGSVPGGSVPGGSSSSGSYGSSSGACDCEAKLAEMQAQIEALEARIAELEKNKTECNCKCGDLLGQIQAAVAAEAQAIANSINYEVSVNGAVVATTEYGTLVADTTGTVTANGASASSNIHY